MISSILCGLLVTTAVASDDAALWVHRGYIALEQGQAKEAIELARTALDHQPTDGTAQALYIDAMIRGGEGGRVLADVMGITTAVEPNEVVSLRDAVQQDDVAAAKAALKLLDQVYPADLALQQSPWLTSTASPGMARLQKGVLRKTRGDHRQRSADWLYQARDIRQSANQPLNDLDDALVVLGERRPPQAPPTTYERSETARALVHSPKLLLPELGADESFNLVSRISAIAIEAKRPERAEQAWTQLRARWDSPQAATLHGNVRLELAQYPEALAIFEDAEILASDPWPTDVAVIDVIARARMYTEQLHGEARALEANARLSEALVAVSLAEQLRGASVDSPLFKRVHKSMLTEYMLLSANYGGAPAERALNRARAATDPSEVLQYVAESMFLYAYADAGPWQYDAAELLWLQSKAYSNSGQADRARARLQLSVLLNPMATPERWQRLGELREEDGQWDAAFAAYSTAAQRGAEIGEGLERVHKGPGSAQDAALSLVTLVPERPPARGVNVKREQFYVYSAGRVARPGALPRGVSLSVGQQMPDWSIATEHGSIDGEHSYGRAIVMFFWVSSCAPCLAALPQVAEVAQDLRSMGRDVAVVAVSMDDEPAHFERVRRIGDKWGQLVRNPEFGVRMGVVDVPTWWIIDAKGVIRAHQTTWLNARHFERALRRALVD
ncbi:MAG: redoxin domain-containing protein [Rhodobacterales bacterium]|nr:redoxin domain-containing protein [Rhodobacterales bacterium]